MSIKVQIHIDGGEFLFHTEAFSIQVLPGHTVAQNIYLSGLFVPPALCSGLGTCGLCRVRYLENAPAQSLKDIEVLGKNLVLSGWRLGCMQQAEGNEKLELPDFIKLKQNNSTDYSVVDDKAALAVDLGTTSIHWKLFKNNQTIDSGKQLNPQVGAGSDVIARLYEATQAGGLNRLSELVQQCLRDIISGFFVTPGQICVAGNTAMTSLLLGIDPSGLATAPYTLPLEGDEEYSLPGLPPVYIPPMLAPFVGADISAGMVSILAETDKSLFPFILADLGTNGEFVLALDSNRFIATSIPMGPAIEGMGLACGGLAGVGADEHTVITDFQLTPSGLSTDIPLKQATTISGTGYLSLLSILLSSQIISTDGIFVRSKNGAETPLKAKLRIHLHDGPQGTRLGLGNVHLTASDIEEFLKVKAAFSLAFKSLLAQAKINASDLKQVFLAGALGEYVRLSDLHRLGFLPHGLEGKVKAVGNSSLDGAAILALNENARQITRNFKKNTKLVSLTEQTDFMQYYLTEMKFIY